MLYCLHFTMTASYSNLICIGHSFVNWILLQNKTCLYFWWPICHTVIKNKFKVKYVFSSFVELLLLLFPFIQIHASNRHTKDLILAILLMLSNDLIDRLSF